MSDVLHISPVPELKHFLNKDNILEIVVRGKKKKFKYFQKVAFDKQPQGEEKKLLEKAVNLLEKGDSTLKKNTKLISQISKLQKFSIVLDGLNLCATCAGFAIMSKKLDELSTQINQIIGVVKAGHEVQADYEFKKVISEHSNMLDSRKTQKYYTEEEMRKLVDLEFNALNMMIDVFMKDLTEGADSLLFSIYSLASMLAVSLKYFDEQYYLNNKEAIKTGSVWHSSHDSWMAVYERLLDPQYIEKLQDHGSFVLKLSTLETDAYYQGLEAQVRDLVEDIKDNQTLVEVLESRELMSAFDDYVEENAAEDIKKAFEETGAMDNGEVARIYEETMKQVALAG